ncbi:MAG: gamma-glutamyltransferase [Gemmatimonadetes bacterium]|nr:gamma-glutamyltransferase [Gemmatimonadota bacterium]
MGAFGDGHNSGPPGRRAFLRSTALGAAAAGLGAGELSAAWVPRQPSPGVADRSSGTRTTDDERRALIAEAHFGPKAPATSQTGMAICSHPLATREAVKILREGGNACDAALSASVTQTVVEPHMTGITGVLSMLHYDAATGETTYVNGGANAPLAPLTGFSAADIATGRGPGVPGFWAGFEAALARHGSIPRRRIMEGAITFARDGFETHPFLWGELFIMCHKIGMTEAGRRIFMPDGYIPRPGDLLVQSEAADTLERLAEEGNDYYYHGAFAEEYSDVVQEAGGVITPEDFAHYEARWQEPAWSSYRGYRIAGSPPPDHGGSLVIEMLNMIEFMDLQAQGPPNESADSLYQMSRIHNLVFEEGGRQNDPDSHPLPLDVILSKDYAEMRFKLLQMGRANSPSQPPPPPPPAGSNHVTVVDGAGNTATILHSCMSLPWSNGLFAGGVTVCASGAHFLRVMPRPGQRATAYVAPNIVFNRQGTPMLASGSPSVGLLANIVQNTTNIIDFGIPIAESVPRPRFGGRSLDVPGSTMVEADVDDDVIAAVRDRGHAIDVVNPWNWHHGAFEGIHIDPDTGVRSACGDPRRCSKAEGE